MQKTRKLIAMLLAVLTVLSMSTVGLFSVSALPENAIVNDAEGNDASGINGEILGLMGDADGNEKINVKDATQIQKFAAKLIELDETSMDLADVDLNGKVNVKDATAIQKWVAKIPVDAPINCLVYIPAVETEPVTTAPTEPATVVTVPETTATADEPTTAASEDEPVVTVPVIKPTFVTEPTEATTKATEATEATTKATEATEATTKATEATEATTKATEATEATEATTKATDPTEATTKATEATETTTEETIITEPTEETIITEATIGAGYYLVGEIGGQTLESVDTLTADRKFAVNGSDYVLYWTTVGGDEYKVAYFDGTAITKLFKAEGEAYYKIGKTSDKIGFCKIEFNPDGKDSWSYTYMTVKVTTERPTEATEATTKATEATTKATDPTETTKATDPTETTKPAGLEAGYYLVGKIGGKTLMTADTLTADRKFAVNGSDYVLYWTTVGGDEYRVAHFDGEKITKYYKAESEAAYTIGATSNKVGYCKIDFNPDGKDSWSYTYFTVKLATENPTDPTDPKPTDPTEPTQPSGVTEGYYLVGTLNGKNCWDAKSITADRKLKENSGATGEYYLDWTFYDGDQVKVVYFDGTAIKTWYNDGGANYGIGSSKAGAGTIYFRPDGNSSWSYYYFTVQPKK